MNTEKNWHYGDLDLSAEEVKELIFAEEDNNSLREVKRWLKAAIKESTDVLFAINKTILLNNINKIFGRKSK